jgi:formate dehydrogenase major subunit
MGPFIMNPEGVARFFAREAMAEGPFPEHYEPFERRSATTRCTRTTRKQQPGRPDVPERPQEARQEGEFPHAATTYRLTEHFHFWTKHAR